VDLSESSINQVDFEYAIYSRIIFSFRPFNAVQGMFRMEDDQRMIIKFFLNERPDVRDIVEKLQPESGEHDCKLRTVRFWITEGRLSRSDLRDEIRTGRPPLDDLDRKKFWSH
jgi:hypothetical protein